MTVPTRLPIGARFLKEPTRRGETVDVSATVAEMLAAVRSGGITAVRDYSRALDDWSPSGFRVAQEDIDQAIADLEPGLRAHLDFSLANIRAFAAHQLQTLRPLDVELRPGVRLGHRLVPIRNVAAYVPGGRYPLIASAFMTVATAKAAGVDRVVAVAPPQREAGGINPVQLAAIALAGADEVYAIGGVQALAAVSFGVEGFGAPVDFLVGAGNSYVTEAKRQLFGTVGIDALAGPSELAIIADETADAELVAADLLGQAEHGPTSEVVLITTSEPFARAVERAVDEQLKVLPTSDIAQAAWRDYGAIILADSAQTAVRVADDVATEHLEIQTRDPEWYFERVDAYGTVFVGADATVAYSDKAIGTNHVLPTGSSARYTGGLWVGTFLRVLTHQRVNAADSTPTAEATVAISAAEGMAGHAESARRRLSG